MAVVQYHKIMREEQEEDEPQYRGSNARRRIRQVERLRRPEGAGDAFIPRSL